MNNFGLKKNKDNSYELIIKRESINHDQIKNVIDELEYIGCIKNNQLDWVELSKKNHKTLESIILIYFIFDYVLENNENLFSFEEIKKMNSYIKAVNNFNITKEEYKQYEEASTKFKSFTEYFNYIKYLKNIKEEIKKVKKVKEKVEKEVVKKEINKVKTDKEQEDIKNLEKYIDSLTKEISDLEAKRLKLLSYLTESLNKLRKLKE